MLQVVLSHKLFRILGISITRFFIFGICLFPTAFQPFEVITVHMTQNEDDFTLFTNCGIFLVDEKRPEII
jgi:hypothetical protein